MGGAHLGRTATRLEDPELLTGRARYLDDLTRGALRAEFVRSSVAHAVVRSIALDGARSAPGVVAVATAGDLGLAPLRGHAALDDDLSRPPLAVDRVRFVGEALAVVVARTRAQALDAVERAVVVLDPLPPVLDPEEALRGSVPAVHPGAPGNLAFECVAGTEDDPIAGSDVVVRLRALNQRVASAPMEPDGVLAEPGPDGTVTLWSSTQRVHQVRDAVAGSLGVAAAGVRVRAPRVGGGFGGKFEASPETVVVAALALRLGRPVAWVQSRTENLQGMPHGRGQVQDAVLGLRRDGTFVGLDVDVVADAGAYPMVGAVIPNATTLMAPGPYRIAHVRARGRSAITTTTPVGAFRGAGRPEATALVERLVDLAADELGVDPVELRLRNLLGPDELPRTSPTGMTYDSGDYARCLRSAVAALDDVVAGRGPAQTATDLFEGTGVAVWLDCTPMNRPGEHAAVRLRVDDRGEVRAEVRDGANDQGQGHRTTWALLLADVLGLPIGAVHLHAGDTAEVPHGEGTGSARSLMLAGGAVHEAAGVLLTRARTVVGELLEAAPDDVVVGADGTLGVAGSPDRTVGWPEVLAAAGADTELGVRLRADWGDEPFLVAVDHLQPGPTFPSGAHAARVAVDVETGRVALLAFAAVDDCGTVVNPVVVEGQQHGGIVQGVAQALFEHVEHDAAGNPRCSTFADYGIPSAVELPSLHVATAPTPSPVNVLGAKGIGQGGAIGATVAVQNAVVDALSPVGVSHIDLPLTPERVWRAIRAATSARTGTG